MTTSKRGTLLPLVAPYGRLLFGARRTQQHPSQYLGVPPRFLLSLFEARRRYFLSTPVRPGGQPSRDGGVLLQLVEREVQRVFELVPVLI